MHTAEFWNRRSTVRQIAAEWYWAAGRTIRHATLPALGLASLQAVLSLGPAASVRITQRLVDLALAGVGRGVAGLAPALPWLAALALALILTQGGASRLLRGPLQQRIEQRLAHALGRSRLENASRLPLVFFETSETYDRLSRSSDPGHKAFRLFGSGLDFCEALVSTVTVALLFGPVAPWLPAALLAVLIPQALQAAQATRRWMSFTYGQTEEQRRVRYVDGLLTGRADQKEIRVFNLHGPLAERWHRLRRTLRAGMLGEKRRQTVAELPSTALSLAVTIGTAFLLAHGLAAHRITAGAFVALFGGVGTIQGAMHRIASSVGALQTGAADTGYVREFLALPEAAGGGPPGAAAGVARFPAQLREGIRLEGVGFTYPGRDRPALDGLNLLLRPGQRIALVGENGTGKSTLAKLLLGLYRPDAGRISADGVDYGAMAPESLHEGVSAVYQDFYRFSLTARESVGVGRVAACEDLGVVRAAARLGGADDFLSALPQGYETPVGHVLQGATDLSGGQWQRVAISRAFMREPQLLILDEPAAALDPRAEADLYERFAQLLGGRGALLISHRLGSARLADRILVLDGGRIAEDGTHEQLLALGGVYARMWEAQAQWYA